MLDSDVKKYKALWAAVLKQAIEDLQSKKRKIKFDASAWFNDTQNKATNSFRGVCETLDLDPEIIYREVVNV